MSKDDTVTSFLLVDGRVMLRTSNIDGEKRSLPPIQTDQLRQLNPEEMEVIESCHKDRDHLWMSLFNQGRGMK